VAAQPAGARNDPLPSKARLEHVFAAADPTRELSAARGGKEQLRRLLHTITVEAARTEKMILGCDVVAAEMDETWRLWHTIQVWWPAIEVLVEYGVTNSRTDAAKTGINRSKDRTGLQKYGPLQARILLPSAARRAA
jgi:hypothetical protein